MALWSGRFEESVGQFTQRFGASLPIDKKMYRQDIAGSIAHARMLARQGVITQSDFEHIEVGLLEIENQIRQGRFRYDADDEDIHMAIERELTHDIGAAGQRLHTGRSRNDQVAVDTHLHAKYLALELMAENYSLRKVLMRAVRKNFGVVMPGYTHMQHAQPVLFSHHLLAYFWMFTRDFKRLNDAYDAANVVVPVSSDFYYQARPTLAIARPGPDHNAALRLDADWGLHPALRDTIWPLYQKGQAAFVPFAGTDDTSRSHFETQDTIELGQPWGGGRNYRSGFMGRLAGQIAGVDPIAFTDQLPLTFQGSRTVPNMQLANVGKPGVDDRERRLIEAMYQGDALAPAVASGFKVRNEVYQSISKEMQAANRNAVSPKGFELAARRIGGLMRDRFNLGFVDVGGWDTHVNQGAASGYLAGRLGELGRGLSGFADEIGPKAWNDTVVVVVSEFGRTFRENGDRGTDHGHGSAYWVLGGGIKGGRVLGEQVKVEQASLFQNRDYPVLTDYRALMGGLFRRVYGFDQARLQAVFPQAQSKDIGLV